jgi:hypothetical protein
MATIEELLKSMLTLSSDSKGDFIRLENNRETWARIGDGTWANDLNFDSESEKTAFLQDFIDNNPYSNI